MSAVVLIHNAKPAADARPERVGVLLVNLGTPDTTDANGVRVYLKEFLSDPRVIEEQGLVWRLVLNGIILRPARASKARDYEKIWNIENNESPLKTITRAQAEKLAAAIADHDACHGRLGDALRQSVDGVAARGADSAGCDAHPGRAALSAIFRRDHRDRLPTRRFACSPTMRWQPAVRVAPPYYDDPVYIEALAVSIDAQLEDAACSSPR